MEEDDLRQVITCMYAFYLLWFFFALRLQDGPKKFIIAMVLPLVDLQHAKTLFNGWLVDGRFGGCLIMVMS